jgi:choline kinase
MKAVILAAGPGTRIKEVSGDMPKCMVKIDNDSILDKQIKGFVECGINDFVILVGYQKEKIIDHINKNYPNINVKFAENEKWETTNYIYTMWLAKQLLKDDIILIHGDTSFNTQLLKRLIDDKEKNCVLLAKDEKPQKDFKAIVENNKIIKIGVEFMGENAFFFPPIYKLTKEKMEIWFNEIEKFIKRDETKVYAENALNNITNKMNIIPLFYENDFCMEIDDPNDLKIAKKYFSTQ